MKKILLGLSAIVLVNFFALGQSISIDPGQNDITLAENTANSTVVATITSSNAMGILTWSIAVSDNPDADANNPFSIAPLAGDQSRGELIVNDVDDLDFDVDPTTIQFTVSLDDDGDALPAVTEVFTVTLTNVNDNDPVITASQSFDIAEDALQDAIVGTVLATDADDGNEASFTTFSAWTIVSGNDDNIFGIDATTGEITVVDSTNLDFESFAAPPTAYDLTVTVGDGTNTSPGATITINVTDVNDKPQLTTTTATIAENSPDGAAIVTLTFSDDEGSAAEFTINSGNDGGAFALATNGELTIADSADFDHETNPEFKLAIRVAETVATTVFSVDTLTVTVTDVNESPVLTKTTFSFNENPVAQGVIGAIPVTDPEDDDLTYTISSGNAGNNYVITADTLRANTPAYFDFETFTTDTLIVSASDGTLSDSDTIFVRLLNVNEPLVFDGDTLSIDENRPNNSLVGTLSADDPEGVTATFKVLTQSPDSAFAINGANNLIIIDSALVDFEINPQFILSVEATDGTFKDTATVLVNINDVFEIVNDKPNFVDQSFLLEENSPSGTEIGTLIATDTIEGPLSYRVLTGNEAGIVSLADSTGILSVNDSSAFDFETNDFFEFEIEVSDTDLTDTATVAILLLNVEEPPSVEGEDFEIEENSPAGTLVGKLDGTDGDGDSLIFVLGAGNNGAFLINDAGTITVANSTLVNFEERTEFVIEVLLTDKTDTVSASTTITVLNANDPPVFENKLFEMEENPMVGDTVGFLEPFDEDGDEISFSIQDGNISNAFALITGGYLVVANEEVIDFEVNKTFTLTITASDGIIEFEDIVEVKVTDLIDNILITGADEAPIAKFYPNPTINRMTVEAFEPIEQLTIADMAGRIMMQLNRPVRDRVVLDTSKLRSGMYILILDHQAFKFVKR